MPDVALMPIFRPRGCTHITAYVTWDQLLDAVETCAKGLAPQDVSALMVTRLRNVAAHIDDLVVEAQAMADRRDADEREPGSPIN